MNRLRQMTKLTFRPLWVCMVPESGCRHRRHGAFTLVEILVSTAILVIVLLVLVEVSARVGNIWKSSAGRVTSFQAARSAFDAITRHLSQATLNTYLDYVDANGVYRDPANPASFVPAGFKRASELHFLSGPAADITGNSAAVNPGHAAFFQAPLDRTADADLRSVPGLLNAVAYYIEYAPTDPDSIPDWLQSLTGSERQFQLRQVIQPTEQNQIYNQPAGWDWLIPLVDGTVTPGVLADNIVLLLIRLRLSPKDEEVVASNLSASYSDETRGSILSPNYVYNSRAWQTAAQPSPVQGAGRIEIMRNQIAPIADVAMVAIDPQSLARLDMKSATPPAVLVPPAGSFQSSQDLEEDLANFQNQLAGEGIRFRTFRTSVPIQSSKWSNSF